MLFDVAGFSTSRFEICLVDDDELSAVFFVALELLFSLRIVSQRSSKILIRDFVEVSAGVAVSRVGLSSRPVASSTDGLREDRPESVERPDFVDSFRL